MMKKLITVLIIRVTAIMMNVPIKSQFIAKFALSSCIFRALYLLLSAVYLPQSIFALIERKMRPSFSKNMTSFHNSSGQPRAATASVLLS
ncbi:hypothetical protein [Telluria beijingensis]|uniref:hypothetical protein n=1 Tax=Telluria beijingensis TaxID=3068633 RepID=UPI0027961485|nr:hypothetical protein [Massilia sp. REN29]